jgi:hypothetical protein
MKKPRYEKKKTRPYLLTGLKTGIDLAFMLRGLTSGADQSMFMAKGMMKVRGDATNCLCLEYPQERGE